MSLSAMLFGEDSFIHKITNIMGLGIPGLLHKWATPDSETEPTRLGELSQQKAKEAIPRPIVWGRVRPIGPNIIHSQKPVKRLVMSYQESGGKGGGKKKEKVYREHVFKTYALGVCEGPITAFGRIWRNNKLVYDGRPGSAWGAKNNKVFLKKFRLYLGTWSQMPDPTLESIWGVGQVPAYRGTAYIVSINEDLTDQGGMVPQWLFEVERAEGSYLTSRPYAVEDIDNTQANSYSALIPSGPPIEEIQGVPYSLTSASLRSPLVVYGDGMPESVDAGGYQVISAGMRDALVVYRDAVPDALEGAAYSVSSIGLRVALLRYENWPDEQVQANTYSVTGVTLT